MDGARSTRWQSTRTCRWRGTCSSQSWQSQDQNWDLTDPREAALPAAEENRYLCCKTVLTQERSGHLDKSSLQGIVWDYMCSSGCVLATLRTKQMGLVLGCSHNKGYSICWSMLGSPTSGNCHLRVQPWHPYMCGSNPCLLQSVCACVCVCVSDHGSCSRAPTVISGEAPPENSSLFVSCDGLPDGD